MLLQPLTILIRWDLPQNPVFPQLLPSPQPHQSCPLPLLSQWKSHLPFSKASLFTSFTLELPSSCFLSDLAPSSSMPSTHKWAHLSPVCKIKQNKINNIFLSHVPYCLRNTLSFPSQPSPFKVCTILLISPQCSLSNPLQSTSPPAAAPMSSLTS